MHNAPKTRPSLILRLRNREDFDAWREFAEIYQPLVYRLAKRKGFQDSDALDVAQEVLIRVAGAVERWDPDRARGSFRGWLHRIARNLMIDFLNKDKRQPVATGSTEMVELLSQQPDLADSRDFDAEYRKQLFAWAAARIESAFRPGTWQAFWMTAVEDTPAAEAADQLGMSVGAVYVARSRVMQRLRSEVQQVVRDDSVLEEHA